jgi:hypothetical protein
MKRALMYDIETLPSKKPAGEPCRGYMPKKVIEMPAESARTLERKNGTVGHRKHSQ